MFLLQYKINSDTKLSLEIDLGDILKKSFNNFVLSGDLFELIDGETMRIHNKEILNLITDDKAKK